MSERCPWPTAEPLYVAYHDEEWGVPEYDDRALFEKLVLDGFQAGLSWWVILKKRDRFREVMDGFDPARMARWREPKIERLLADEGIVRSRAKIEAARGNARIWLDIQKAGDGAFRDLLWDFVGGEPRQNRFRTMNDVPAATPESEAMSKALKKMGFKFCGPTICYAFMQAVGMVNDHLVTCPRHAPCAAMARPARG